MLIQEKINALDPLLTCMWRSTRISQCYHPLLRAKQFPYDPRGGMPSLSAAAVLTIVVRGAWRGLKDKAKVYFYV